MTDPKKLGPEGDASEGTDETFITRRRFVVGGIAAVGGAVVWAAPFPFADAGIGQLIDNAYADTTGTTGHTGGGGGGDDGGGTGTSGGGGGSNDFQTPDPGGSFHPTGQEPGSITVQNTDPGQAVQLSWPAGAFGSGGTVTVNQTQTNVVAPGLGFDGASAITIDLQVKDSNGNPVTHFNEALKLHFPKPTFDLGYVAFYTAAGGWVLLSPLPSDSLAAPGPPVDGYFTLPDGSIDVFTLHATIFAVIKDNIAPSAPPSFAGQYRGGALHLSWGASKDNSGSIAQYVLFLNGTRLFAYDGGAGSAAVRTFEAKKSSAFTLAAVDPSGNVSTHSGPVTVVPNPRPASVPRHVPQWAYQLLSWEQRPAATRGDRPTTPSPLPAWYAAWRTWRKAPYRLA